MLHFDISLLDFGSGIEVEKRSLSIKDDLRFVKKDASYVTR